jgi:hypothetical protein
MGLRDWIAKLRGGDEAEDVARASEQLTTESAQEREILAGDIEGAAADNRAARAAGQPSMDDIDALGS